MAICYDWLDYIINGKPNLFILIYCFIESVETAADQLSGNSIALHSKILDVGDELSKVFDRYNTYCNKKPTYVTA